jgi:hypothetical protein
MRGAKRTKVEGNVFGEGTRCQNKLVFRVFFLKKQGYK